MKGMNYLAIAMLSVMSGSLYAATASGLTALNDQELAAETGQALFNLTYTAPTDTANLERTRSGGEQQMGFYKLGMEADLELNLNAKKLQLGCGGTNGAGACDIDIDYVSLSGVGNSATSNTASPTDRAARVGSSAKLVNPFMELAIKNPDTASTRQFVGLRLSSEQAFGLLTFGLENGVAKSGINSLSGYMQVKQATGKAKLNNLSNITASDVGGQKITGRIQGTLTSGTFESDNYSLDLVFPAAGGDLVLPQQTITGKRITSAPLTALATVNGIQLAGRMTAQAKALGLDLTLDKALAGTLSNLKVAVTIDQSLGMVHKADLNGSPASLSLQGQDIQWPGAKSVAQKGWWLELSNPIDIGDVSPVAAVDVAAETLRQSLVQVSQYLDVNPVQCGFLYLGCLTSDSIDTGPVNLPGPGPHATMALRDLTLANQNFTPNCYGNLKFC